VYKGSPELKLDELPSSTIALAITMTALVVSVLSIIFWMPYVYCKVVRKDHTIRWYHFFYGPLLWKRPVPEVDENAHFVPDYRVRDRDVPEHAQRRQEAVLSPSGSQNGETETKRTDPEAAPGATLEPERANIAAPLEEVEKAHPIEGAWYLPKNLWIFCRYKILAGLLYGSRGESMQTSFLNRS